MTLLHAARVLRREGFWPIGPQLRFIVGQYHMTAPDSYIRAEMRRRAERNKAKMAPDLLEAVATVAVALHRRNVRILAGALRGGRGFVR